MTSSVLSHAVALGTKHGMSVVPIDGSTKRTPSGFKWAPYQKKRMDEDSIRETFSQNGFLKLGIITGHVSDDLECIDFDDPQAYTDWRGLLCENGQDELLAKLTIETSPRGGAHVYYRCPGEIKGNQKLARRPSTPEELELNPAEKIKGLIETRGEGGLIVCHPSEGYQKVQGDLAHVPLITPDEREMLLYAARSFDQIAEERTDRKESAGDADGKPGADFNARAEWSSLLEPKGWQWVCHTRGRDYWRRPGKTEGWSATTGNGPTDLLHVFSTSVDGLESEKNYSKFAVRAILDFGGDYGACAKALAKEGYGTRNAEPGATRAVASDAEPVEGWTVRDAAEPIEGGARRWTPTRYIDLRNRPKRQMLFEGLLGERDHAMMFGAPKSGKTFVITDLLECAIVGGTFAGKFRATRPLTVAYCTNEGLGSLHARFAACQTFNEVPFEELQERLFVFEEVPQLYTAEGNESIRAFAEDWEKHESVQLDLLIIDTLNKATLGADENDAGDASIVSAALRDARKRLGCATFLVHHSGRAGEGPRGSSVYDGDLDIQLKVEKQGYARFLKYHFAKDVTPFDDLPFALSEIDDSCAVRWIEAPQGVSSDMNVLDRILLVLIANPEKDLWTIAQMGELLPDINHETLRKTIARDKDASVSIFRYELDDGRGRLRFGRRI